MITVKRKKNLDLPTNVFIDNDGDLFLCGPEAFARIFRDGGVRVYPGVAAGPKPLKPVRIVSIEVEEI